MFPISYRDLELMLLDRKVEVDHTTIFRWIQAYAAELEKRIRPHLRTSNGSWRVDETYVRVKGRWTYLYRAVDSCGQTIDFLLSAKRDAGAAKRFFRKALAQPHTVNPRTVTVDKNPAYPKAIVELKEDGELWHHSRLRQSKYLNNIVEQDHRRIKRLVRPGLGFGSFRTARRTLAGVEAMAMIRKRQVRNINGSDIRGQATFIAGLFGIAAKGSDLDDLTAHPSSTAIVATKPRHHPIDAARSFREKADDPLPCDRCELRRARFSFSWVRQACCPAASRISRVISSGWEISERWLAFTSMVLAPMRLAMKRSRSGLIVRSSVETA
jgi:transposase, IS6 family